MNYVLAVALAEELEGIHGDYNTLFTGVGKINATSQIWIVGILALTCIKHLLRQ